MTDTPEERRNAVRGPAEQRRTAVRRLDLDWGRAYLIFSGDGVYSATRLDNGRMLTAGSAGLLRRKIELDFSACPVPDEACEDTP